MSEPRIFTSRARKCILSAFEATAKDANNYYEILRDINIMHEKYVTMLIYNRIDIDVKNRES